MKNKTPPPFMYLASFQHANIIMFIYIAAVPQTGISSGITPIYLLLGATMTVFNTPICRPYDGSVYLKLDTFCKLTSLMDRARLK